MRHTPGLETSPPLGYKLEMERSGGSPFRQALSHGYPISTWTRTACMTCVEKGVEYELVPVLYGTDAHGEMHPFRRMPILEVDGSSIFETLAITGYLDENFVGPSLQPESLAERTRMRTWMGVCGDYIFRDVVRTIPRDRAPTNAELTTAREALARAEGLMSGDAFLAGGSLSLADLYLAPQIANCREKAPELLDGLDAIDRWSSSIAERESFQLTQPNRST
jgi:glutathione S-transferase